MRTGHNPVLTQRYQHLTGTVLDTVAEKVGDHLRQRGPEQPENLASDN